MNSAFSPKTTPDSQHLLRDRTFAPSAMEDSMTENHRNEPTTQSNAGRVPTGHAGNDDDLRNALQAKTSTYYDDDAFGTLAEALAVIQRDKSRERLIDILNRANLVKVGLTPLMQGRERR
jgi:hypothetical protein